MVYKREYLGLGVPGYFFCIMCCRIKIINDLWINQKGIDMKNQVAKATEPKEIVYRITIQEGAFVATEDYTFERIFLNNKEEGDDFEFMYTIQSYYWEQMMKMELNESIFFAPDRNDEASKGIIIRVA